MSGDTRANIDEGAQNLPPTPLILKMVKKFALSAQFGHFLEGKIMGRYFHLSDHSDEKLKHFFHSNKICHLYPSTSV